MGELFNVLFLSSSYLQQAVAVSMYYTFSIGQYRKKTVVQNTADVSKKYAPAISCMLRPMRDDRNERQARLWNALPWSSPPAKMLPIHCGIRGRTLTSRRKARHKMDKMLTDRAEQALGIAQAFDIGSSQAGVGGC